MLTLGQTHTLRVVKMTDQGAYVDGKDLGEILLPRKFCASDLSTNDHVEVFLYQDSETRLITTTQTPKACVGEFAYLEAVENTPFGTFLDWGLDKDLLVPFAEQHRDMQVGQAYLVHLFTNQADGRITASSKIDKFLSDRAPEDFAPGQAVDLIIAKTTDLGFKAIINHSTWGLLYKDEVNERLSFGQSTRGFIKFIRPDGKVDLALGLAQEVKDQYTSRVLDYLADNNGFAPLHDKTDANKIKQLLGMSKKSFKKTIGGLFKARLISIEPIGIRLTHRRTKN